MNELQNWQGKRREQIEFSTTVLAGAITGIVLLCTVLSIIQNFY
jgi:hypothetical protein